MIKKLNEAAPGTQIISSTVEDACISSVHTSSAILRAMIKVIRPMQEEYENSLMK